MPYLNIYLVDRLYGGPEEGGWYYTAGEAIESHAYPTKAAAERALPKMQKKVDDLNVGRPDIHSVLSRGQYQVYQEDEPGANFPKERPIYE